MASPNPDSFERALRKFKNSLPPAVVRELSICTLDDVRKAVKDIQRDHGHSGKLRNMKRLEAFVEAMNQFGEVVQVFLNASELLCFIWGPIKFLLTISKTYMDSFDKLLDAYSQIGDVIPGLLFYRTAFEKHAPLACVLEDYYSDILRFHSEAIRVFKRPKWKTLFHATWKTFDTEFASILRSLIQRRELLDGEKSSAMLYEVHKIRDENEAMRTEWRENAKADDLEKHMGRVAQIKHKLEAASYQLDQEVSTENRGWGDSSQWIFQDPRFVSWGDPDSADRCVLYVNGKPGAGKTTLVSAVVEKLLDDKRNTNKWHSVAYFYFKHDQADRNTFNAMLRALLEQLIDQDPATTDHFFKLLSSMAEVNLRATKALQDHLKTAFECYEVTYLVLDGLDECAAGEATKVIEWILSIANQPKPRLRVLFSGQRDGVLDILLSSQESISLETSAHLEDIRAYTEELSKRIQTKFKCSPSMTQDIISLVTSEAKGMFLYARVVLDNLLGQTRLSGLRKELEPGIFPKGLDKAYDRVASRVIEHASEAERQDALKVLGLVTSTRRTLFWREIQAFLCIDPAKAEVDYDDRLQVSCKELCGALLDTHISVGNASGAEDRIQIVHETARQYLFEKKLLHAREENIKLSTFCLQYLTSKPLEGRLEQDGIVAYAKQGYYSLQDYTVQYWFEHLWECVKSADDLPSNSILSLIDLTRRFLVSYGLRSKLGKQLETRSHGEIVGVIKSLPQDARERDSYFGISLRILSVRQEIERFGQNRLGLDAHEAFTGLHGDKAIYKCNKPWCDFFTAGFDTPERRTRHVNAHDLPFYCPSPDCFASSIGFSSQSQLAKHQQSYHGTADDQPTFPTLGNNRPKNLLSAAARGDLEAVADFLKSGEDINQTTRPNGAKTALVLAARSGHIKVCELLLSQGADPNLRAFRVKGESALAAASREGHLDIVHLLLSDNRTNPHTALETACRAGNPHIVMALLIRAEDNPRMLLHAWGLALEIACSSSNAALVQSLLQQGYHDLVSRELVAVAIESELPGGQITELLLSTAHFAIEKPYLLKMALTSRSPSAVEAILSYPKLRLSLRDLKECLDLATKIGFGNMDSIARVMIRDSGLQPDPTAESDAPKHMETGAYKYIKGCDDWLCISNPYLPRVLDVSLHHSLRFSNQGRHPLERSCTFVHFSPDGRYLAINQDYTTHILDFDTGDRLCELVDTRGHFATCFSPCGKYLATGDSIGSIAVLNIQGGSIHKVFLGHEERVYHLDFSKDGRTVASGGADKTVRLWDFETGTNTLTVTTEGRIGIVAISPDMLHIAAMCDDTMRVRVWDIQIGHLVQQIDSTNGNGDGANRIVVSPSGLNLIWILDSLGIWGPGTFQMWETKIWERDPFSGVHNDDMELSSNSCLTTFIGHKSYVNAVAMTPDAAWILSGDMDGGVRFWDSRTGQAHLQLQAHNAEIAQLAVCPTGRYFSTALADGQIRIWSLHTV